ncbi:hypothetical protein SNK03_000159 [Fusarium graminearum]|uniref:Chromosome 1, complete genome n=1 Tax=Gibberella zeae (strain ATCC MYA-4620 / CBS 123657 / FGSC 9075 / NRRL 31084 / PH-1) TaxID=229533 RepID=I1R9H6_GIBZE|nr:hypothetical protein FGSG_00117 [Fusarium graminearum PH-1]CAF3498880.1 unnamed protein product [Fusarium graminearum]ESU05234.1 hypothetical protein FGSG_00117 [Fusarium graminearum PH-1]CAF3571235.1 unnamed protein product [Fusarium graminearum]CAG1991692.1 unnamed protein product [Fusarium graminearum]CEF71964.1 unnamed protein product [Fusarium graminearum]|eukprot:XP_011315719.1 hypothetical protein FGSG_00117 [Fusarium graminearum PH-1]
MSQITLRDANYSDLPEVARVMSKAFWNDNLFGDLIHPHREKYPDDPDLYWLRRARVSFWDYRWRGIVAIAKDDSGKDVIAGIAQWERLGKEERNSNVHISIPIRNLFKPLSSLVMNIHARIWPNRAADPENEDIIERTYPYFERIWSGKRAESWYLSALAVHPDFQRQGVGKRLAQWGIEKAQAEGVCASLVAAHGTDDFYIKLGFDEQFGRAGDGESNPLADVEGSNMYWYWPRT